MKQPKILYLLCCVQMGKFFSHYGMRALLILYMVEAISISDMRAFSINAVFCGIVELGGIFGGLLADRVLGLRRAAWLGARLLLAGYLGLIFKHTFYAALPIIVLGASLFSGNLTALVGQLYEEDDPRRKKGFTLFYMFQNLGALISTSVCGILAQAFGFRIGFTCAATGMGAAAVLLCCSQQKLRAIEKQTAQKKRILRWLLLSGLGFAIVCLSIGYAEWALPILPWITSALFTVCCIRLLRSQTLPAKKVRLLCIYLVGLSLFFAVEDQICSSLLVFSERVANRSIFGWTLPSSILMSINPIVIVGLGALIAKFRFRLVIPFTLTAAAFGCLGWICLQGMALSFFGVMGIVVVISIAELMVGPMIMSYASEVASHGHAGTVMGMVPIAFSVAFLLSGKLSQMVALEASSSSLLTYGAGFTKMALLVLVGGIGLEILRKRVGNAKRPLYE